MAFCRSLGDISGKQPQPVNVTSYILFLLKSRRDNLTEKQTNEKTKQA